MEFNALRLEDRKARKNKKTTVQGILAGTEVTWQCSTSMVGEAQLSSTLNQFVPSFVLPLENLLKTDDVERVHVFSDEIVHSFIFPVSSSRADRWRAEEEVVRENSYSFV